VSLRPESPAFLRHIRDKVGCWPRPDFITGVAAPCRTYLPAPTGYNRCTETVEAGQKVEGGLDIRWENYGGSAPPKYRVLFGRYDHKFKGGAQRPKWFHGTGALESYLLELGFTAEDAKNWIKKVHAEYKSVPITHVMMPERCATDYQN